MTLKSRMHSAMTPVLQRAIARQVRLKLGRTGSSLDMTKVAIVCSLSRANGLARGAELQYADFRGRGLGVELIDVDSRLTLRSTRASHESATAYIVHAAAPETALLLRQVLPEASSGSRIGYWAWELPDPPADWAPYESLVSEIWTPSTFAACSLRKMFACNIRVVPHRVTVQARRARDSSGSFRVLVMADSRSSLTRKNPLAAIEAFELAFGGRDDVELVLKLSGHVQDIDDLIVCSGRRANISVITDRLSDLEMQELMRSCDVFLSLHRSEGFGLPMLEAMANGIPVVGTGWSGNLEFMTDINSVLVPFKLVPVRDDSGIYRGDSVWAEPDVEFAARALRKLSTDEEGYERLAKAGHDSVMMVGADSAI